MEQITPYNIKRRTYESIHYERTLIHIPEWVIPYTDTYSVLRTQKFDMIETYLPERDYSWSRLFTSDGYLHTDIIADSASEELIKRMQIQDIKFFLMERLRGGVYIYECVWFGIYFLHEDIKMSVYPVCHIEETIQDCVKRTQQIMPDTYLLFHNILNYDNTSINI
jgi:hypothetical protein